MINETYKMCKGDCEQTKSSFTLYSLIDFLNQHIPKFANEVMGMLRLHNKFCHSSNVEYSDKLNIYNIQGTEGFESVGMIVALEHIWNLIKENHKKGRRSWVFIDEAYPVMRWKELFDYLYLLQRKFRKQGATMCISTQAAVDFLKNDYTKIYLSNIEYIVSFQLTSRIARSEFGHLLEIGNVDKVFLDKYPGDGVIISKTGYDYFTRN